MITRNYFMLPFYLPRICRLLRNWPEYLLDYLLRRSSWFRKTRQTVYRLRDGTQLTDNSGTLAGTMAVVFVRREYGRLERLRTIVDVGANIGCFAIYAARACPSARVYCYEPTGHNFDTLKRNIKINGLADRISAFQSAVTSHNGQRDLAVTAEYLMNSFHIIPDGSNRETVNCTTLEAIFASQKLSVIDLLKMNSEGSEYEILESCSREVLARIANIRLEYHRLNAQGRTGEWLLKFLQARGYRIERFTRYRKAASGFIWAARAWMGSEVVESLPTLLSRVA